MHCGKSIDGLKAGYTWVVDADVASYFDTIPHARLVGMRQGDKVSDGQVLQAG